MGAAVSFYTLGCKVNHCDTEDMAALCKENGIAVRADGAGPAGGTVVINTCAVTSKAEQKGRRVIRAACRAAARVIITGCYAELDAPLLKTLERESGAKLTILRKNERGLLPSLILNTEGEPSGTKAGFLGVEETPYAEGALFRSRPFIRIQSGCDNACAFCRTRLARGRSVSEPASHVLAALAAACRAGAAEAVLTGVNVCQYRDPSPSGGPPSLAALIRFLVDGTERIALRLSSLEPDAGIGELAAAAAHERVRPHFHLSVQSGDAGVLRSMGRRYGPQEVKRTARLLREAKDDPFIACDIIAGFPGETEAAFRRTVNLCEELDFAWIHAFPYSPRPGTAAYGRAGRVPEREAARRAALLGALARRGRLAYITRQIERGRPLAAVLEKPAECGFCAVLTENYIKARIEGPAPEGKTPGSAARCRLTGVDGRGTVRAVFE